MLYKYQKHIIEQITKAHLNEKQMIILIPRKSGMSNGLRIVEELIKRMEKYKQESQYNNRSVKDDYYKS